MQVTEHNDVKVYNLSAGKSLPQFLEEARKKSTSLRYDQDFRKRIDLIQDFEFAIASQRVRVSVDGQYIAATGTYAPEVRIFDSRELGLKCARGLDHEVVDFIFLSDDYRKLAFLLDDRTIEFHAQFGRHHRLRVPKAGRSLSYDNESCVLFVGGSSDEVIRLDLEGGTFQAPIKLRKLGEVNQVAINSVLPVLSCAGDGGLVESYDLRDPTKPLQSLQMCGPKEGSSDVMCCAYSPSGMHFAAGNAMGLVRVYDVRSSRPLCERDHMNGYPIRSLGFHTGGMDKETLFVGSADSKSIKIWDATTGAISASVECPSTINHVEFCPNSGLFFVANDQQRIGVYFVPTLGLAPKWCSFLDSMTEELEESNQKVIFDDYQFVTVEQLEQLGAKELIGSKFLQPYMHGYFMDHRLHKKLTEAGDPFAYEDYKKKKLQEALEKKRTMRTKLKKKRAEVNPGLQERLQSAAQEGGEEGASKKRKEAAEKASHLLADKRFETLFADPDFEIDEKGPQSASAAAASAAAKSLDRARTSKRKKGQ